MAATTTPIGSGNAGFDAANHADFAKHADKLNAQLDAAAQTSGVQKAHNVNAAGSGAPHISQAHIDHLDDLWVNVAGRLTQLNDSQLPSSERASVFGELAQNVNDFKVKIHPFLAEVENLIATKG